MQLGEQVGHLLALWDGRQASFCNGQLGLGALQRLHRGVQLLRRYIDLEPRFARCLGWQQMQGSLGCCAVGLLVLV